VVYHCNLTQSHGLTRTNGRLERYIIIQGKNSSANETGRGPPAIFQKYRVKKFNAAKVRRLFPSKYFSALVYVNKVLASTVGLVLNSCMLQYHLVKPISYVTRVHHLRLFKRHFHHHLHKFYFGNRIISIRNSLPNYCFSESQVLLAS
jgi:hypothetical protein